MINLVIIGCGRAGAEIEEFLSLLKDFKVIGFYDDLKKGDSIFNAPEEIPKDTFFVNSIFDHVDRKKLTDIFIEK